MVVSTVEYLISTYILGEAVGMPRWDGGRRDANTRNPVKLQDTEINQPNHHGLGQHLVGLYQNDDATRDTFLLCPNVSQCRSKAVICIQELVEPHFCMKRMRQHYFGTVLPAINVLNGQEHLGKHPHFGQGQVSALQLR